MSTSSGGDFSTGGPSSQRPLLFPACLLVYFAPVLQRAPPRSPIRVDRAPFSPYSSTCRQCANPPIPASGNAHCRTVSQSPVLLSSLSELLVVSISRPLEFTK